MKTSNKLLLGLLIIVVLGMIIANLRLKYVIEKNPELRVQSSMNNSFLNIKVNGNTINNTPTTTGNLDYGLFADKTKVLLSIDKNMSYEQLNEFKSKLKKLNIDFNIRKIEFDSDNKITKLKISVDCNDGYKGSATESLKDNGRIGFYRIYSDSTTTPFGMNAIALQ